SISSQDSCAAASSSASSAVLSVIHFVGIEDALADGIAVERAVETALVAGVAGPALLADAIEERVAVAVDPYLLDVLDVTARLPFLPELVAAAGVVVGEPRLAGALDGLRGGVGDHQHRPGARVLGDDRH